MFCIVANVKSDRALRTGARVWVSHCNGDASHPYVMGLNKSGRFIRKFIPYKRLKNFRAAWIPEHLRGEIRRFWDKKEEATAIAMSLNAIWKNVRHFDRHGQRLVVDGITEGQAFELAKQLAVGFSHRIIPMDSMLSNDIVDSMNKSRAKEGAPPINRNTIFNEEN